MQLKWTTVFLLKVIITYVKESRVLAYEPPHIPVIIPRHHIIQICIIIMLMPGIFPLFVKTPVLLI